jgi:hypothetical protein
MEPKVLSGADVVRILASLDSALRRDEEAILS